MGIPIIYGLKKINISLLLMLLITCVAGAQTLRDGVYTSEDGKYSMTVEHKGRTLYVNEPNKKNVYESKGGAYYYHTESQYSTYYVRVVTGEKLYTGKEGGAEYAFFYTGEATKEKAIEPATEPAGIDNCPVYDKYNKLLKAGEGSMVVINGCMTGAKVACTYPKEKVGYLLGPTIQLMKSVMDNSKNCPCLDAISKEVWDSVK